MILRSLTKHVKDQNWFAVWLDLFIVVLGVFIGIQVSNINEANKAAKKEAVVIEQLRGEFEAVLEETREEKSFNDSSIAATQDILRVIRDGVEPQDRAAFLTTAVRSGSSGSVAEPVTLTELLSSGRVSEISSAPLRSALIKYHEKMISHQNLADLILQRSSTPHDGFHAVFYIDPDAGPGEIAMSDYDWSRIAELREQQQVLFYGKTILSGQLTQLIGLAEAVLAQIKVVQQ